MFHTTQLVLPTTSSCSPGRRSECSAEGLEVLEDDAAVAVHDALGHARGAGGEEHPQRVVERQRVGRPRSARRPARRPSCAVARRRPARRPGGRPRRRPGGSAAGRGPRSARRCGRCPDRRSGSRRRRSGRRARAAGDGRRSRPRRTPGRRPTTPRPPTPRRAARRPPRSGWAGRRPPGRRAGPRARAGSPPAAPTCRRSSARLVVRRRAVLVQRDDAPRRLRPAPARRSSRSSRGTTLPPGMASGATDRSAGVPTSTPK